jgi:uncharacterized protein YlxW (UPF0749 family)
VWLIALLVAIVATVQIRSQAEVERSFAGTDTASLAFLIDNLHRSNDSACGDSRPDAAAAHAAVGGDTAADQVLADEAAAFRAAEGLVPVHGPGVVLVVNAVGLASPGPGGRAQQPRAGGARPSPSTTGVLQGRAGRADLGRVTVGGVLVPAPWTISAIGDANRLAQAADDDAADARDRRVRQATYRVEADVVIRAVVIERPSFTRTGLNRPLARALQLRRELVRRLLILSMSLRLGMRRRRSARFDRLRR